MFVVALWAVLCTSAIIEEVSFLTRLTLIHRATSTRPTRQHTPHTNPITRIIAIRTATQTSPIKYHTIRLTNLTFILCSTYLTVNSTGQTHSRTNTNKSTRRTLSNAIIANQIVTSITLYTFVSIIVTLETFVCAFLAGVCLGVCEVTGLSVAVCLAG